ncbi:MAG: hypothetical protein GKR89_02360 [Candidatus Latescibacteria bacterium]|nr:hypothetical protein [Candidatus Latescibacterota bacterium]
MLKYFIVLLAALGLVVEEVAAGAWTQAAGSGYFKLGTQWVRGKGFREENGRKVTIPTLADYTTSLYGEYGLRDNLTLVGYMPFFKRITLNKQVGRPSGFVYFEGDDISGLGDAQLGLRYRLAQLAATTLSAELAVGLPLGDDTQPNGLLTGDGEANQQLTLKLGRSFYPAPSYINVDLGFNNRIKGYSDEYLYAVEVGYTFRGRLTAILHLRGTESLSNGDDGVSGGMGGLYANNQSYLTFGPELIVALGEDAGLSLSAAHTARAENALEAPVLAVGFFLKR